MKEFALTTIDNPFDPITDFDRWYDFDESSGYHTCSLIGRLARTSRDLTDEENDEELMRTMREIVRLNLSGKHKLVIRDDSS